MLKLTKKNLLVPTAFFLFFLMSFRTITFFLPAGKLYYLTVLASVFLMYLYGCRIHHMEMKYNTLFAWVMLLIPLTFNNQDVKNSSFQQIIVFYSVFVMIPVLNKRTEWVSYLWNVIRAYCLFHFLAGLYLLIDKKTLMHFVIPHLTFPKGGVTRKLLMEAISAGYMTGLCNHYSTMGMIMSICVISFSDCLFTDKKNPYKVIWFFITAVGLAITGKRGPLLFTIVSIAFTFILFSKIRLSVRSIITGIVSVLTVAVASFVAYLKVPQVRSVIERFTQGGDKGNINDMTTGRVEYFWIPALKMFRSSPLIGHGWRSFSHNIVNEGFGLHGNDAHNIYIQLLAETGIIGFIMVVSFFILTWFITFRQIKRFVRCSLEKDAVYLKLSLTYQTFFLLYGLSGNPLYDIRCYPLYLVCALVTWSYTSYKQNTLITRRLMNLLSRR